MSSVPRAGEFDLIARHFTRAIADPDVLHGIGDDGAVLAAAAPIVVAVDTIVEGVHFPSRSAPADVGYRALAVNLSDIAAMGARPRWATLALTLPGRPAAAADEDWVAAFAAGFFELAERFGVSLVGGDLTRGPLSVTLQLIGTVEGGCTLLRGGGRDGDDVYVTGTLGDAAAGLASLMEKPGGDDLDGAVEALRRRFRRPAPRVAEGLALAPLASAAIDVSDGLVADLGHICRMSGCGARLDVAALPMSDALRAYCAPETARRHALSGGDDYELCFTAEPGRSGAVERATAAIGTRVTRIGRLTGGRGVECLLEGEPYAVGTGGYEHFTS